MIHGFRTLVSIEAVLKGAVPFSPCSHDPLSSRQENSQHLPSGGKLVLTYPGRNDSQKLTLSEIPRNCSEKGDETYLKSYIWGS